MNPLDRLISFVSPQSGVNRAAARRMLRQFERAEERSYASAGRGRRNRAWTGRASSANNEVGTALGTLRDRARQFVRDSWAGQRILDVMVSHAIGTGIQIVPNTGSDRIDRRAKLVIEEWSEQCDAEGVSDFGAMQALAFRSTIEGGDSVLRMIDISRSDAGRTVPMRLLGLEGDQIDTSRDLMGNGNCRLGVELGEWGRRQGLWLLPDHPGEMRSIRNQASALVDWSDLCHLYRPLRFGQVRGITAFAPILLSGRDLSDLIEAAIVQSRTQASFAGFLHRQPGAASPFAAQTKEDDSKKPITSIEPGMIADIGDAEITFASPSSQSVFGEAYLAGAQAMAAGAGLTYDQLTGDLRQANYSSLRAGKIEFRRLIEQWQWLTVVPTTIRPIRSRLFERAVLAGILPNRRDGYRCDYIMPAVEPIDPKKDLEADILAVRAGRLSPQRFISAWGWDHRDVIDDFGSFLQTLDDKKFTLDIDPRQKAKGKSNEPTAEKPDDA